MYGRDATGVRSHRPVEGIVCVTPPTLIPRGGSSTGVLAVLPASAEHGAMLAISTLDTPSHRHATAMTGALRLPSDWVEERPGEVTRVRPHLATAPGSSPADASLEVFLDIYALEEATASAPDRATPAAVCPSMMRLHRLSTGFAPWALPPPAGDVRGREAVDLYGRQRLCVVKLVWAGPRVVAAMNHAGDTVLLRCGRAVEETDEDAATPEAVLLRASRSLDLAATAVRWGGDAAATGVVLRAGHRGVWAWYETPSSPPGLEQAWDVGRLVSVALLPPGPDRLLGVGARPSGDVLLFTAHRAAAGATVLRELLLGPAGRGMRWAAGWAAGPGRTVARVVGRATAAAAALDGGDLVVTAASRGPLEGRLRGPNGAFLALPAVEPAKEAEGPGEGCLRLDGGGGGGGPDGEAAGPLLLLLLLSVEWMGEVPSVAAPRCWTVANAPDGVPRGLLPTLRRVVGPPTEEDAVEVILFDDRYVYTLRCPDAAASAACPRLRRRASLGLSPAGQAVGLDWMPSSTPEGGDRLLVLRGTRRAGEADGTATSTPITLTALELTALAVEPPWKGDLLDASSSALRDVVREMVQEETERLWRRMEDRIGALEAKLGLVFPGKAGK